MTAGSATPSGAVLASSRHLTASQGPGLSPALLRGRLQLRSPRPLPPTGGGEASGPRVQHRAGRHGGRHAVISEGWPEPLSPTLHGPKQIRGTAWC